MDLSIPPRCPISNTFISVVPVDVSIRLDGREGAALLSFLSRILTPFSPPGPPLVLYTGTLNLRSPGKGLVGELVGATELGVAEEVDEEEVVVVITDEEEILELGADDIGLIKGGDEGSKLSQSADSSGMKNEDLEALELLSSNQDADT